MAEYIERQKAIFPLYRWKNIIKNTSGENDEYVKCLDEAIDIISDVPAADVAPVVRCKNCVFYGKEPEIARAMNLEPEIYCAVNRIEMGPDAFCSYGRTKPWIEAPVKEVDNG